MASSSAAPRCRVMGWSFRSPGWGAPSRWSQRCRTGPGPADSVSTSRTALGSWSSPAVAPPALRCRPRTAGCPRSSPRWKNSCHWSMRGQRDGAVARVGRLRGAAGAGPFGGALPGPGQFVPLPHRRRLPAHPLRRKGPLRCRRVHATTRTPALLTPPSEASRRVMRSTRPSNSSGFSSSVSTRASRSAFHWPRAACSRSRASARSLGQGLGALHAVDRSPAQHRQDRHHRQRHQQFDQGEAPCLAVP
jgi:hypothetical protein